MPSPADRNLTALPTKTAKPTRRRQTRHFTQLDQVTQLVAAALYLAGGHQPRVDRIAELGDHDQVVDGPARGLALSLRGLVPDQVGHAALVDPGESGRPATAGGRRC